MSTNFGKVEHWVNNYFTKNLQQGYTVREIMDSFRVNPLPVALTESGFSDYDLRRHGQLISTRYLIEENNKRSLPTEDLLGGF